MTHQELMDMIETALNVAFWAIIVISSIIVIGMFTGYAVDKIAQNRIDSGQYVARCPK
jgi:hypothetical protein